MKINLAENMIRFGVKNLNESSISKVKTLAEQETETPNVKLGQLNEKSFAPITAMYGKGPLEYLKRNWSNLKPGTWIHMPTNSGILTAFVKDPGSLQQGQQNTSIKFLSFTYIKPITVTVPAEKTLVANPKTKVYDQKGTNPVVFNFIAMEEVQVTNQSWLQNNTVGKIPMEVLNDAPIFPKSTIGTTIPWGYATGDQIITYKVGRATGKVGADPVRYDKLMAAFITNQITKKFTNEHDLLSSKTFADFAKNVTPKPGTIEEQWVKMAGDDLVQLVYSKVGFATTEPSQAAALPVNTPPVPPTNR